MKWYQHLLFWWVVILPTMLAVAFGATCIYIRWIEHRNKKRIEDLNHILHALIADQDQRTAEYQERVVAEFARSLEEWQP